MKQEVEIRNKLQSCTKENNGTILPPDWKLKELQELLEFKNGINAGKESYGSGVKFINVMEVIYNDKITPEIIPGSIKISNEQLEIYKVKNGDLLFNRTSETTEEIGLASVYSGNEEVVFGGFVIRGREIVSAIDNSFKPYCFRSEFVRNQIIKSGQGAVRSNIGQGDLKKVKILLPPLNEQITIASCLSTWDNAIQKTAKLIAQKEKRKKWLMQVLLTGKKRLPAFAKASEGKKGFEGEWKEEYLKELLVESKEVAVQSNVNKRLTVKLNLKGIEKREVRGTETDEGTVFYTRKAGQFIYGKQNLHKGAFGIIPEEFNGYESSQDIPSFNFTSKIFPQFLFYYFSREEFYTKLENISTGTGSKRIQPKDLFKVSIPIPSLKEQEEISNVLKACDKEIIALKEKLNLLKEQKKGLMQVLLTGRKRLIQKKL